MPPRRRRPTKPRSRSKSKRRGNAGFFGSVLGWGKKVAPTKSQMTRVANRVKATAEQKIPQGLQLVGRVEDKLRQAASLIQTAKTKCPAVAKELDELLSSFKSFIA